MIITIFFKREPEPWISTTTSGDPMDGLASLLMALMALACCGLLACRAEVAGDRIASRYGEPRSVGVLIEWQLQ